MENWFSIINWDSLIDIIKAFAAIGAGGGVMSLLVSALVGVNWPSQAKALVAFLMCLGGSAVGLLVAGVDFTNLAVVLPLMWIGSQAFYRFWFKPRGIANFLETAFWNEKTDGPLQPQPVNEVEAARFGGPLDRPAIEEDNPYRDQFHP